MKRLVLVLTVFFLACGSNDVGPYDTSVTDPGVEVAPEATEVAEAAETADATEVAEGNVEATAIEAIEETTPEVVTDTLPDATFFFANRTPSE